MIAALKLVPIWAWAVLALIVALAGAAIYQTISLGSVRTEFADYRSGIDKAAKEADEAAGWKRAAAKTQSTRYETMLRIKLRLRLPTLLLLSVLLTACSSKSISCSPVAPPSIPKLPQEARQSATSPLCSPTCASGLTKRRESWRQLLMQAE